MRTKEFIKKVEELGFEVWISGSTAYVLKDERYTVARVKTKRACAIDFFYLLNERLDKEISEKLFDIIVEYAKTPIEDREEEKKFYLRHRYLVQAGDYTTAFLNYDINNDRLYVYTKVQTYSVKTQFTVKEMEEIKEKFDTDLKDFELVEVVDED